MSASKRSDVFAKTQKVLAKHYTPKPIVERPVLETMLYAYCLEDSRQDAADEAFARLQESFFDWNEVRVTNIRELGETLRGLKDPVAAATKIKQTLHSVFESIYDFDLDTLKKQNLGAAVKQLQQYKGTDGYSVSFTVQNALGGHQIPVSAWGIKIMHAVNAISDKEAASGNVPGLERAIPKTKGAAFASQLQQLAADLAASPFNNAVRAIIQEVDPEAKSRLPSRRSSRKSEPTEVAKGKKAAAKKKAKGAANKPATPTKASANKSSKKTAKKATPTTKKTVKKKKVKKATTSAAAKKKATKKTTIAKKASRTPKKSASKQLVRRKPR